jgi:hypothetical protein
MDLAARKSVTLSAGVSQSGKTTFALRYLLNAPLARRFIFDPDEEISRRLKLTPARTPFDLETVRHRPWIIFDPNTLFPGRHAAAFSFFCDWCFAISATIPGAKCLLVDEVWKYCSPAAIPPELATICQTGRKRGLGLFVCTQRPNQLNGAILGEVNEAVAFKLQFPRALETMQKNFQMDPAGIANLPMMHFRAINTDTGGTREGIVSR